MSNTAHLLREITSWPMIGNHNNEVLLYVAGLAATFGMAGDITVNGRLTGYWPVLAALFVAGFWFSYNGGFKK
jgi:hypothetical protein